MRKRTGRGCLRGKCPKEGSPATAKDRQDWPGHQPSFRGFGWWPESSEFSVGPHGLVSFREVADKVEIGATSKKQKQNTLLVCCPGSWLRGVGRQAPSCRAEPPCSQGGGCLQGVCHLTHCMPCKSPPRADLGQGLPLTCGRSPHLTSHGMREPRQRPGMFYTWQVVALPPTLSSGRDLRHREATGPEWQVGLDPGHPAPRLPVRPGGRLAWSGPSPPFAASTKK